MTLLKDIIQTNKQAYESVKKKKKRQPNMMWKKHVIQVVKWYIKSALFHFS